MTEEKGSGPAVDGRRFSTGSSVDPRETRDPNTVYIGASTEWMVRVRPRHGLDFRNGRRSVIVQFNPRHTAQCAAKFSGGGAQQLAEIIDRLSSR